MQNWKLKGFAIHGTKILPLESFEERRRSMKLSGNILRTLSIFRFDTLQKLTPHRCWKSMEILPFALPPLLTCYVGFHPSKSLLQLHVGVLNTSSPPKNLGGLSPQAACFSSRSAGFTSVSSRSLRANHGNKMVLSSCASVIPYGSLLKTSIFFLVDHHSKILHSVLSQ